MAGSLIFLVSYIYFVHFIIATAGKLTYPVLIIPVAAYALVLLCSYTAGRIYNMDIKKAFSRFSRQLSIFALLFLAQAAVKINLPSPHNIILRKLEILIGASFILFVALCVLLFLLDVYKNGGLFRKTTKDIFKFITVFMLLFYFSASLWFNYANKPVGDEPSYLMVSHSILHDRDLDLRNNYANGDFKAFYEREIVPHEINIRGRLISTHPVSISLIAVPFYALAGRQGVTFFINMLTALLIGFIFLIMKSIYNDNKQAFFTAFLTGVSMPVLMYSNQVCTDVFSGLIITAFMYIILFRREKSAIAGMLAALLPWAHTRNLVIFASAILIIVIEYRKEVKKMIRMLLTPAVSLFSFFIYNFSLYGSFIPRQTSEALPLSQVFSFNINGLLGLFFDQEFGLFIYTPVFIFIIAGIAWLYARNRKVFWYSVIMLLPYFLMIAFWRDWRGGGGSSPRFFVPVIFFFTVLAGEAYLRIKDKAGRFIIKTFIYTGLLISLIMAAVPWFRWNAGNGSNRMIEIFSGFVYKNLAVLFPVIWAEQARNWPVTITWAIIVFGINAYVLIKNK